MPICPVWSGEGEKENMTVCTVSGKKKIHTPIYTGSKRTRGETEGGEVNSRAVSTILDCIDHSLLPHTRTLSFPRLSLPLSFLSVLPPSLLGDQRLAFSICGSLLYAIVQQLPASPGSASKKLQTHSSRALTFFPPLGLEVQDLHKGRKDGRGRVKRFCYWRTRFHFCFINCWELKRARGDYMPNRNIEGGKKKKRWGFNFFLTYSVKTFCWFWRALHY